MDGEKQNGGWKDKLQRHTYWARFWIQASGVGIGILLVVFGIIKFSQWGTLRASLSIIGGILVLAIYLWRARENWKRM